MHGSHDLYLAHMGSFSCCEYYDVQMKCVVVYGNIWAANYLIMVMKKKSQHVPF